MTPTSYILGIISALLVLTIVVEMLRRGRLRERHALARRRQAAALPRLRRREHLRGHGREAFGQGMMQCEWIALCLLDQFGEEPFKQRFAFGRIGRTPPIF